MKKIVLILLLLVSIPAFAQVDLDKVKAGEKHEITQSDYDNKSVDMADRMRENGKIYVVVGVILIIFLGITFYAVRIDRKLSKIEGEVFGEKVNS
ncbi:CcmD family protein [Roseivirga sp. E12]|uniref:CcmD family protein n=1 Tax=Roseivirga sp. E12 TaxID=2819237 RepID=UPI001ABC68FA|nr:CcmD family protein [Roseivirga sp. E12]MBO3698973.1 CcmD family protein [Roseivirga sp. E12]